MNSYTLALINQIAMMFVIIGLGYVLKKIRFFSDEFVKELSTVLYLVISPLNIFNSFLIEYTEQRARLFAISFVVAFLSSAISIVLSELVFKKENYSIEKFALIITNAGFLGLPIVSAVCGDEYKIYAVPFIAFGIILQVSYGAYLYTRDKKYISFKSVISNAAFISVIVGIVFFVLSIPVPLFIKSACSSLGNMVAPVASLIIGANLSGTNLSKFREDKSTITVILLRQLVCPFICMLVLCYLPKELLMEKMTMLIIAGTPPAAATSAFARMYDCDYDKASRVVCVSTISFIVTIALVMSVAMRIW